MPIIQIIAIFADRTVTNKTNCRYMKKNAILCFAVIGAILFVSCEKNLYDPNKNPEKEPTIADLIVPENFNWELSHQVSCTINTQQASSISIYSDEACKEEQLATFTAEPNDKAIVLSLPTATKMLYLQYETTGGATKVIAAPVKEDKTIAFVLPNDAKVQPQSRAMTRESYGNALFTYPANWGTVLFEDMFPLTADYDFNDFVAKYQIGLTSTSDKNKHFISNMRVSLYVYAIGGTIPYTPYFRLVGIDKNDIDLNSVKILGAILNNPTPGVEVKVVETTGNELVVEYKNATNNPHKREGSPFLNTEPGFITKMSETTQISFEFNFKSDKIQTKDLLEPAIDFFLANKDRSKEIHLRGYEPVFNKYPYGPGLSSQTTYCSDRNLVWAIKMPDAVRHAIEKANFLQAYTHFAEWATSGGQKYENWYNRSISGNANPNLLIKWAN